VFFDSASEKIKTIYCPAKQVTCHTWGGLYNDTLFITSAMDARPSSGKKDLGGYVFSIQIEDVFSVPKWEFRCEASVVVNL
jgi:sugar lactone lactonase YvrE